MVDATGVAIGASVEARASICAAFAGNRGQYQRCVVKYADTLLAQGLVAPAQKDRIASCAARQR